MRGCQILADAFDDSRDGRGRSIGIVSTGSSSDWIIDSNAFGNQTDDNNIFVSINDGASNSIQSTFTISNNIIFEGDAYSEHPESIEDRNTPSYRHSMGFGCSTGHAGPYRIKECSIIGNFFAHNGRRNPQFWSASGEVVGNYVYNPNTAGVHVWHKSSDRTDVWVLDNTVQKGPNAKPGKPFVEFLNASSPDAHFYARRNTLVETNGTTSSAPNHSKTPNISLRATYKSDYTTLDLACVGPIHRDANLQRIFTEEQDGTGEVGIGPTYGNPTINDGDHGRHWDPTEGGDASFYLSTTRPGTYDTDGDGIEDGWETANGLDPNSASDANGDLDGDGYTNLEEFLNYLIRCS